MSNDDAVLIDFLRQESCSWHEIEIVLRRLREYDNRTMRESVFDSIASGTFSLKKIIEECNDEAEQC